jgi:hypothetical protein
MKQNNIKKYNMKSKNLEKIFMLVAFVSSASSMIISLYHNVPWIWQFNTMLWVIVTYIKTKEIEKHEI